MNKLPLYLGFATLYTALDAASFIHALRGLNITPWNPTPALGPAISRAIVEPHGRRLWGEVGDRGIFKIILPIHDLSNQVESLLSTLTPREQEVMDRVVAGRHNREIAAELGISPRTVEVHKARMMDKLGVGNVADLVRLNLQLGKP